MKEMVVFPVFLLVRLPRGLLIGKSAPILTTGVISIPFQLVLHEYDLYSAVSFQFELEGA